MGPKNGAARRDAVFRPHGTGLIFKASRFVYILYLFTVLFSRVFQNQNQYFQLSFSFHKVKSDKQKISD